MKLRLQVVTSICISIASMPQLGCAQSIEELEARLKREQAAQDSAKKVQIEGEVQARIELEMKRMAEEHVAKQLGVAGQLVGTKWTASIDVSDKWEDDNGRSCRDRDKGAWNFEFSESATKNQVQISLNHYQKADYARSSCYDGESTGPRHIDCTRRSEGLVPIGQTGSTFRWQAREISSSGTCESDGANFTRVFTFSDGILKYQKGDGEWLELYPQ